MRDPLARLLDLAAPQHGLFTLAQASEVDVVDAQVRQMAARGVLERRSAGVYRITTCRSPVGRDRGSASQIGPGCLVAVVAA